MVVYADTSFLFSLYAQDANTCHAAKLTEMLDGALILTPLQCFELRNALRLSTFRGDITKDECRRLLDLIETDLQNGALVETLTSWVEVYREAEALSAAHTAKMGIRGLDVLHVASAVIIGAGAFYTFDVRQRVLAVKAGMKVKP